MMHRIFFGVVLFPFALLACNVDSAVLDAPLSSAPSADKFSIVMSGSSIAFGGNQVQLGQSLASWKKAVPGAPRCSNERVSPVMCTWDQIGLQVGTDDGLKNVEFASLFLLAREVDLDRPSTLPDGSPASVSNVSRFRADYSWMASTSRLRRHFQRYVLRLIKRETSGAAFAIAPFRMVVSVTVHKSFLSWMGGAKMTQLRA